MDSSMVGLNWSSGSATSWLLRMGVTIHQLSIGYPRSKIFAFRVEMSSRTSGDMLITLGDPITMDVTNLHPKTGSKIVNRWAGFLESIGVTQKSIW
eukprot:scaffold473_cov156-Amphora_coffeaeformis.AAC.5